MIRKRHEDYVVRGGAGFDVRYPAPVWPLDQWAIEAKLCHGALELVRHCVGSGGGKRREPANLSG